jgi:sugar lactone lactonase YvrE
MDEPVEWQDLLAPAGNLYESARWIESAGVFQWVDILESTIHRWSPESDDVETRQLATDFATAALPLDASRSIVTSRDSAHEYDWGSGALRLLGRWDFPADIRFNDGNIAPDGQVYVGTMSMSRQESSAHLLRLEGERMTTVLSDVGISNGLVWTDQHRAYYVDSLIPAISVIDLSGPVTQRRTFCALGDHDEPDGLAVTGRGDLLVAMWEGRRLVRIRADGARLADISVPALSPTSVAVGGAEGDLLLVTTASSSDVGEVGRVLVGKAAWARAD